MIFIRLLCRKKMNKLTDLQGYNICILAQEKIGDFLLLLPLLQAWKKYYPESSITVITSRHNKNLFEQIEIINRIIHLQSGKRSFYRTLNETGFDILYNPKDHISRTFLFLTLLIKATLKIGLKDWGNSGFYDILINPPPDSTILQKNMLIFSELGIDLDESDYYPDIPVKSASEANTVFSGIKGFKIGLNLSAGIRLREWPVVYWEKLISSFSAGEISFILFGMHKKQREINIICDKYTNAHSPGELKDIFQLNAYLRKLDLLITPDTALLHLACLQNIPVIAMFQNRQQNISRYYHDHIGNSLLVSSGLGIHAIEPISVITELRKWWFDKR